MKVNGYSFDWFIQLLCRPIRRPLILLLFLTSCANTHEVKRNHCGGVQVPICEHTIENPTALNTIEEQEKKLKQSMLRVMTLVLDQMTQTLLKSIAP